MDDCWCLCKLEPIHTNSFDVVSRCQVSELITFFETRVAWNVEASSMLFKIRASHPSRFFSSSVTHQLKLCGQAPCCDKPMFNPGDVSVVPEFLWHRMEHRATPKFSPQGPPTVWEERRRDAHTQQSMQRAAIHCVHCTVAPVLQTPTEKTSAQKYFDGSTIESEAAQSHACTDQSVLANKHPRSHAKT